MMTSAPVAQKLAAVAQKTDKLPKKLTDNQHLSLAESDTSSVALSKKDIFRSGGRNQIHHGWPVYFGDYPYVF